VLKLKNLFLILASLVFAVGILGVSVVRTTAQTSTKFKIAPLANVSPSPAVTPTPAKVDYYLAYPGILPDHFLYSIKMVRDRVLLFFTNEPLKKAELLLLFADKRLGAGQALIEGGKAELGVSTLTKAEKYLERAIEQAKVAKNAGKDTTAFYEKLRGATLKHQEVLEGVEQKVPEQAKPVIEELKKYSRAGYESVVGEAMNK
jgi:hypothetical protein